MRPAALAALTALFTMLGPLQGVAQDGRDDWWHQSWGWGHMMFGGLMMILFWGGIAVLVVLLLRHLGSGSSRHQAAPHRQTPIEILRERFARGEIDRTEYEQRRKLLSE